MLSHEYGCVSEDVVQPEWRVIEGGYPPWSELVRRAFAERVLESYLLDPDSAIAKRAGAEAVVVINGINYELVAKRPDFVMGVYRKERAPR